MKKTAHPQLLSFAKGSKEEGQHAQRKLNKKKRWNKRRLVVARIFKFNSFFFAFPLLSSSSSVVVVAQISTKLLTSFLHKNKRQSLVQLFKRLAKLNFHPISENRLEVSFD